MTTVRTAALAVVVLLVTACGPGAREKTIHTTLEAVNAARAAMVVWDDKVSDQIVATAPDEATGQVTLEQHWKKRDELVAGFEAAYYAIAIAATSNSNQNLADMLVAAGKLWDAYKTLTGGAPPKAGAKP